MPNQLAQADKLFYALGDRTRLAVVQRLCQRPETVSSLAEPFKMALPSFLHHLRILEDSGWLTSSKAGRVRTCQINPEALSLAGQWLQQQKQLWEGRLDRMDDYVLKLRSQEKKP